MERDRFTPEDLNFDLEEMVVQWKLMREQIEPHFLRRAVELYKNERNLMQARINVLDALGDERELEVWKKTVLLTDMKLAFLTSKEAYSAFLDEAKVKVNDELFEFMVEIGVDHLGLGKESL